MKVSTTKDRRLTSEESKGAYNERLNNSHIKQIKEVWEISHHQPVQGRNKGGVYKRSLGQGERPKGAKDQRFDCQTPSSQENLGDLGFLYMEGGNLI
jgi:hypothetical protein